MRLGRSRVAAAEVVASEDERESTPYELLEAGIIDVVEFQAMRARIGATSAAP